MTDKQVKEIVRSRTPIDSIIGIYRCGNFVEVVGKAGSDTLTYRIYDNGSIVER